MVSSQVMYFVLKLMGITIGRGNRFYGLAKFVRMYQGSIVVGERCVFRSLPTSNLIGINRPCIISALTDKSRIIIGNNCGFSGTVVGCFKAIDIGNDVMCGANTLITDGDWHLSDRRSGEVAPVFIEDGVWIGANVTILKGVRIGSNSVIGAGSVVVKDIPSNVVAAGNPCKIVRQLA